MDITGGQIFQGDLPTDAVLNPHDVPRSRPKILPEDRLVAEVAAQITEGRLQPSSLTDLTPHAHGRRLTWSIPPGHWRLMAFWLVDNSPQFAVDQVSVIDYLSKDAIQYFAKVMKVDSEGMEALAAQNGIYLVTPALQEHHATRQVAVDSIPGRYEVAGPWQLVLEGDGFPRTERTLSHLTSWTDDPGLKHFSGTSEYTIPFHLPTTYFLDAIQLRLSVGAVGNVADVELNGHPAGVIWMRGQTLDVTSLLKLGKNIMKVLVTNTLINRVAGSKSVPPLPPDLKTLYGRGLHDDSPQASELFGFKPLPRSGLLGPVHITPLKRVRVNWQ